MLYKLHELKKVALWPVHQFTQTTQKMMDTLDPKGRTAPYRRIFTATNEMVERGTRIYQKPKFGIQSVFRDGEMLHITEAHPAQKPFCTLKRFDRRSDNPKIQAELDKDPIVLIVAPLSGHFATLLRDTVRAMLPYHRTYITDWKDAKMVSLLEGEFTLETYVDYLLDVLRGMHAHHHGQALHVIAVCQPAVPVLAAVSLLATYKEPCQPATMTLMGGPIDTRINPGSLNEYAASHDLSWFEYNIIDTVPSYYPGVGRKVCPGFMLLGGFMSMNMKKHSVANMQHFEHLIQGDMGSAQHHRGFYDEYRAVLDVPAPYFLDSLDNAFIRHTLPQGKMTWRGYPIDTHAIEKTALLTIEGELDDISCAGQTLAAHDLCKNIPQSKKKAYLQKGVGHYGIFNGRRWREIIQPKIAAFIRQNKG